MIATKIAPCQIYKLLTLDMAIQEVRTTQQHGIKRGSLRSILEDGEFVWADLASVAMFFSRFFILWEIK
jgi:hypothetical protein